MIALELRPRAAIQMEDGKIDRKSVVNPNRDTALAASDRTM